MYCFYKFYLDVRLAATRYQQWSRYDATDDVEPVVANKGPTFSAVPFINIDIKFFSFARCSLK